MRHGCRLAAAASAVSTECYLLVTWLSNPIASVGGIRGPSVLAGGWPSSLYLNAVLQWPSTWSFPVHFFVLVLENININSGTSCRASTCQPHRNQTINRKGAYIISRRPSHGLSPHRKKDFLKIQKYIHEGANLKLYIPEFFNFKLYIPEYSPI
jgi:hypothetical protein